MSWACDLVAEMPLILKKNTIVDLIIRGLVLNMTVQRNVHDFVSAKFVAESLATLGIY